MSEAIGDELIFFKKGDRQKIRSATSGKARFRTLAIHSLLCELASDSGRSTFPLDVEFIRMMTHMSREHVVEALEQMEWLGVVKLGWEGITIAYPSKREKKKIVSEAGLDR